MRRLYGLALPVAVLLTGFVLSAGLALVLLHNATQDWQKRAELEAARRSMTLLSWIEESYATLSALVALVENSSNVDAGEFLNAVDGLEARTKVNFMPVKAMLEFGNGEWMTKHSSAPPNADPAFPKSAAAPQALLQKTLGKAQNTPGEWFLSVPFVDSGGNQFVYVALVPAAKPEFALVGVLAVRKMAQTLLDADGSAGLTLQLKLKIQDDSAIGVITASKAAGVARHHSSTLTQTAHADVELAWQFSASFGGGVDHRLAWGVGGACGMASVLLALFVWGQRRQGLRIEQRVKESTGELAAALRKVEDEAMTKTQVAALLLKLQRVGNYPELADTLLPELAVLLELGQASLYRADTKLQQLTLCGAYAGAASVAAVSHIAFGSGLVGQCAVEKHRLVVTGPPADYITIRSALVRVAPVAIVLIPIVSTQSLLGVLELACTKAFSDVEQQLMDQLLPMVAMAMEIIARNENTQDLLRSSQEQAAALDTQRTEIAQLLQEQESIFQNAPHGIIYTGDGIMLRANQRVAEYFGTTVDQLVGQASESIYRSVEDFRKLGAIVGPQLAAGKDVHLEWEFVRKDGAPFSAMISGQGIHISGHQRAAVWMFEDISARKKAEQAVNEARETLEVALTSAKMGAWKFYPLEGRLEADAATMRLYGLEGVEMDGSLAQWFIYVDPQDAQNVGAVMQETMAQGLAEYRTHFRVIKPDHETVHIMSIGRFTYDGSGKAVLATGLVWDISDIKRAERAILMAAEEQEAIFESATLGIAFIKDRLIVRGNDKLAELFGLPVAKMVGHTTRRWYPDEAGYEAGGRQIYDALKQGITHQREQQLVRADGSVFWCQLSGRAVDANDLSRGTVWMLEDVTDRKVSEEKLRLANFLSDQALDLTRAGHWHIPLNTGDEFYNSSERAAAIFGDPPRPDWRYHLMNEWFACVEAGDKEAAARTFENFNAALAGTVPQYDATYAYKRPIDGRVVWVHAIGHVVRDANGAPTDMFGVTVDVTEAKLAKMQLDERIAELERFNRLTIDREEKMIELKGEINDLRVQAGLPSKYKIVE